MRYYTGEVKFPICSSLDDASVLLLVHDIRVNYIIPDSTSAWYHCFSLLEYNFPLFNHTFTLRIVDETWYLNCITIKNKIFITRNWNRNCSIVFATTTTLWMNWICHWNWGDLHSGRLNDIKKHLKPLAFVLFCQVHQLCPENIFNVATSWVVERTWHHCWQL